MNEYFITDNTNIQKKRLNHKTFGNTIRDFIKSLKKNPIIKFPKRFDLNPLILQLRAEKNSDEGLQRNL